MALVMNMVASEFTDISGYTGVAEVRYGANGDTGSPSAEYDVMNSGSGSADGRFVWDDDISDGMSTGQIAVEMVANANSDTIALVVDGASAVTQATSNFSTINQIAVRAGSSIAGGFDWSGLSVKFYSGNTLVDTYDTLHGPTVDQSGSWDPGQQQSTLYITPQATADRVVIAGFVSLKSDAGWYPDENSMFGQVFVFAT